MKKSVLALLFLLVTQFGFSQVGINTASPNAQLDIQSSNQAAPSNTDGILIPKIDAFPLTNPTVAQQGMMVYLTTISAGKQPGFYHWDNVTVNWIGLGGSSAVSGWSLTGNAGTNPATNFVGTTDNNDVIFRRDNVRSGWLGNPFEANTSFGVSSLNQNSIGTFNSAFGTNALVNNTEGNMNTAIGASSLETNIEGMGNTGVGSGTLNANTVGGYNTASGTDALRANTTGLQNTANGSNSLAFNINGSHNVAIGSNASLYNKSSENNVAVGSSALQSLGFSNGNVRFSTDNVAVGKEALFTNNPTAITNGIKNTALGNYALRENQTGEKNTALGFQAGNTITSGSNNLAVGANANVPNTTANDQMSIANVIYGADMSTTALGKIGIGIPVPTEKLEVAGKTKTTDLQVVTGAGAGKILTSDAVGNATWQNAGAAGGTLDQAYDFGGPGLGRTIIADAGAVTIDGLDGLVATGGANNSGAFMPTGAGTRMVWNPRKASFRAGYVNGTQWNDASVGYFSTAFGTGTTASGDHSIAFGAGTIASGNGSTAFGASALASGDYSTAFGSSIANGAYSAAFGFFTTASGDNSTAFGNNTMAIGFSSTAFGNNTGASGASSTTFGSGTAAIGAYSTAFGGFTTASGDNSTVFGNGNTASSYGETVLGIGATIYTPSVNGITQFGTANATDRLLAVGNAIDADADNAIDVAERRDALVILKNGNTGIGASAPTEKLEVAGKTKTTTFQMTTGATLNTLLVSDALGNGTWQNPNFALNGFAWTTTGNSLTNSATNFIGTTDNVDVVFKRNNVRSGLLNGSSTSFGVLALNPASTGNHNSALGWAALNENTTGICNSAFGAEVLMNNETGNNNAGFGYRTLYINSGGSYNVAFGNHSLYWNTWASNNVGVGFGALRSQGLGSSIVAAYDANNVAVGVNALDLNNPTTITNGINNTAIGHRALSTNTIGTNNTAIGYQAGDANSTGSNNISIGANSDVLNPAGNNQMSIANVIYGDAMDNIATARFSIGAVPSVLNKLYVYSTQLTANNDGQSAIYGYRTRDSRNDGVAYSRDGSNSGVKGYNLWGDLYSFGVSGFSDNDETAGYSRSGGVLGAKTDGAYWGSLGYRSSGLINYGVYASAANYGTGTGRMKQSSQFSIGGGFYGGLIGSWSKGEIGNMNSGTLFASYNSGDEYTSGKQIEIVETNNGKKAAYTVTSTESIIYKKGKITLLNGTARIDFDSDYAALLGDVPVVTTTPMGQCNGIYIESVDKAGFVIRELNNGTSNVAVSWIAVGDRIDAGKTIQRDVLADDFDSNVNEVMFNENNKQDNAKAIWSEGNKINFGKLPENLIEKTVKKEK
jgi:trimeric autotransporter adhesin